MFLWSCEEKTTGGPPLNTPEILSLYFGTSKCGKWLKRSVPTIDSLSISVQISMHRFQKITEKSRLTTKCPMGVISRVERSSELPSAPLLSSDGEFICLQSPVDGGNEVFE